MATKLSRHENERLQDESIKKLVAEEQAHLDDIVYTGFSHRQLSAAFDKVHDPCDWKAPIRTIISVSDPSELAAIIVAIVFFTGTWPTCTNTNGAGGYHIEAIGYRAGPCGDH
jgi:hypothetical protein